MRGSYTPTFVLPDEDPPTDGAAVLPEETAEPSPDLDEPPEESDELPGESLDELPPPTAALFFAPRLSFT
ncbi:MAG: hypothetical protein ACOCVC_05540 [Spirochaeta sp.]